MILSNAILCQDLPVKWPNYTKTKMTKTQWAVTAISKATRKKRFIGVVEAETQNEALTVAQFRYTDEDDPDAPAGPNDEITVDLFKKGTRLPDQC